MRIAIAAICSVILSLATVTSQAVEGGAVTIDTLSIDAFSTDGSDAAGFTLLSEIAAQEAPLHWNILAGLNYRDINLDYGYDDHTWGGELGTRYYYSRQTTADIFGTYDQLDVFGFQDVTSLTVGGRHSFLAPRSGITPYILATGALRFKDHRPGTDTQQSNDSDVMFSLGAGCDFMLTHTLAMGFQYEYIGITDSTTSSDYDDASHLSVCFKGYWDYAGRYEPNY